jgi:hypothetical protein
MKSLHRKGEIYFMNMSKIKTTVSIVSELDAEELSYFFSALSHSFYTNQVKATEQGESISFSLDKIADWINSETQCQECHGTGVAPIPDGLSAGRVADIPCVCQDKENTQI